MPESLFTATLTDVMGLISGHIQEQMQHQNGTLTPAVSIIDGLFSDGIVSFIKTYDGSSDLTHSVHYEGHADTEGNEIEGHWHIPDPKHVFSGRFLMIRTRGNSVQAEIKISEKIY